MEEAQAIQTLVLAAAAEEQGHRGQRSDGQRLSQVDDQTT